MGASSFKRSQITAFEKYRSLLVGNDATLPSVEYLVIAGGGGGGGRFGGGGGAGGYRSSVIGESSGGPSSAESVFSFSINTNYTVTVGAGGVAGVGNNELASTGVSGNDSIFSTITSIGGGGGGGGTDGPLDGGSGGGNRGGRSYDPGLGTLNQGNDAFTIPGGTYDGESGGGGAGGESTVASNFGTGTDGGVGLSSAVSGATVGRAGGGASFGKTGFDGGGDGFAGNGTVNTGGGGAGGDSNLNASGGSGGSGVVILRYPSAFTITIGAGLTATTSTVGDNKVTEITAGTGNVSWS